MYRSLIYPLLQRLDAERTHDGTLRLLAAIERAPAVRRALARALHVANARLQAELTGLQFSNPLGVAAGLDKNAVAMQTWGALGWGHVEVGTVTPQPQRGNEQPRVFRLPQDQALINRMGFPGQGMHAVRNRLSRLNQRQFVVGANIGANKTSVEAGRAVDDYVRVLQCLYPYADYFTVNVSSPNTARLRELQGAQALGALIAEVVATRNSMPQHKPVFLKIAPDLEQWELQAIVAVCVRHGIDALVAANTTIARPTALRGTARAQIGGLSGAPVRARSTEIIRTLHMMSDGALPIIGVGGVFSADDVWEKLQAGARLVQIYTGLVYEGPLMAWRIKRDLLRLMDRHGVRSLAEIVVNNAPAGGGSRS
jgi:dihydroorotate dehydrogenase